MSPAQKRTREKMGRYDPKLMEKLRAEITKHPNPMFGRMIAEGRMSDSDVLDFSLNVASAYFDGSLLEPVAKAAGRELERMTRQAWLQALAFFGWTASFSTDGVATLTEVGKDDQDAQIAAVQALVNEGLSVKDAMAAFKTGPPEKGQTVEMIQSQLSEMVH